MTELAEAHRPDTDEFSVALSDAIVGVAQAPDDGELAAIQLVQLVDPFARKVLANMSIFDDTADELVATVIVKVWRSASNFQPGNASAWVQTITRNTVIDGVRSAESRMRQRTVSIEGVVDFDGNIPDDVMEDPYSDVIEEDPFRSLDGKVPAAYLKALELRVRHGYSYDEIAKILDVPVGTVRSRISRAKEKIRELYDIDKAK